MIPNADDLQVFEAICEIWRTDPQVLEERTPLMALALRLLDSYANDAKEAFEEIARMRDWGEGASAATVAETFLISHREKT